MSLEIDGKVVTVLEEQRGGNAGREWIKQSFVIEVPGRFPKRVCFVAWGDQVDKVKDLLEGDYIKVSFDLESREYAGRWYTDAKAWRIVKSGLGEPDIPPPPSPMDLPMLGPDDDLPF
jgi:hypothetical protein